MTRELLDSFWRAAAYCLHPKVIALSLAPLAIVGGVAAALGYFYWEPAVAAVRATLEGWALLDALGGWLGSIGGASWGSVIAPLVIVALAVPAFVVLSLFVAALLMTPAIVRLVAARRFPLLEKRHGGGFWSSLAGSLGCGVVALLALVVSIPFWFVPPLVLVLPPLIWGWLTYRVLAFDALALHASRAERLQLLRDERWPLLGIGIACGLGAVAALGGERADAGLRAVPDPGLDLALHAGVRVLVALVRALPAGRAAALARRRGRSCATRAGVRRQPAPAGAGARIRSMNFGLLIIGDEILSGKRADKHLPKVIELLAARGLGLAWARLVGDDPARITADLKYAFASGDVVFSCGGIGATPDDHTRQCAAAALGVPLAPASRGPRLRDRAHEGRGARAGHDLRSGARRQPAPAQHGGVSGGRRDHSRTRTTRSPAFRAALGRRRRLLRARLSGHGLADDRMGARPPLRPSACPAATKERSVIVFGAMEAALTPLMEAIEAEFAGVKVFSLPSVDHPEWGRHIELGVKGEPGSLDAAAYTGCARGSSAGAQLGWRVGLRSCETACARSQCIRARSGGGPTG